MQPATPREDIVVSLWPESWSDLLRAGSARPPARLVDSLRRAKDVDALIAVNPPRSFVGRTVKRTVGRGEPTILSEGAGWVRLIEPVTLRRRRPTQAVTLQRSIAAVGARLQRQLERLSLADPEFVTFNPLIAGFCDLSWTGSSVYYARDDWTVHPDQQPWWAAHELAYRLMRERAVPVVAVSRAILERIQPTGPSLVLPNGIDADEWLAPPPPPRWVDALPRPLIVYVGMLDGRLDPVALEALSTRFPSGTVVLAGPLLAGHPLAELAWRPNVHVVRPEDRPSVVGLIATADVCVIPHRRTPLTQAMNPLKLYEYLAAGRPTASVDLEGCRDIDPSVVLCAEGADLGEAAEAALEGGPMDQAARRSFIDRNRWTRRHEQLREMLREQTGPGR